MTVEITGIEVKGFNGNGKVKQTKRDPGESVANKRFGNFKPNLVEISGSGLDEIAIDQIEISFGTASHSFEIIEIVLRERDNKLDVYFITWTPANTLFKADIDPLDVDDLTVTVETVADESETEDDVTIED